MAEPLAFTFCAELITIIERTLFRFPIVTLTVRRQPAPSRGAPLPVSLKTRSDYTYIKYGLAKGNDKQDIPTSCL